MSLSRRTVRPPFRRPAAVGRAACARPTAALRHACIITTSRGSARTGTRPARAEPLPLPGLSAALAALPRPRQASARHSAASGSMQRFRPAAARRPGRRASDASVSARQARGASLGRSRAARPRPAPGPFAGTCGPPRAWPLLSKGYPSSQISVPTHAHTRQRRDVKGRGDFSPRARGAPGQKRKLPAPSALDVSRLVPMTMPLEVPTSVGRRSARQTAKRNVERGTE